MSECPKYIIKGKTYDFHGRAYIAGTTAYIRREDVPREAWTEKISEDVFYRWPSGMSLEEWIWKHEYVYIAWGKAYVCREDVPREAWAKKILKDKFYKWPSYMPLENWIRKNQYLVNNKSYSKKENIPRDEWEPLFAEYEVVKEENLNIDDIFKYFHPGIPLTVWLQSWYASKYWGESPSKPLLADERRNMFEDLTLNDPALEQAARKWDNASGEWNSEIHGKTPSKKKITELIRKGFPLPGSVWNDVADIIKGKFKTNFIRGSPAKYDDLDFQCAIELFNYYVKLYKDQEKRNHSELAMKKVSEETGIPKSTLDKKLYPRRD